MAVHLPIHSISLKHVAIAPCVFLPKLHLLARVTALEQWSRCCQVLRASRSPSLVAARLLCAHTLGREMPSNLYLKWWPRTLLVQSTSEFFSSQFCKTWCWYRLARSLWNLISLDDTPAMKTRYPGEIFSPGCPVSCAGSSEMLEPTEWPLLLVRRPCSEYRSELVRRGLA